MQGLAPEQQMALRDKASRAVAGDGSTVPPSPCAQCRIQKNRSTVYGTDDRAGGKAAGRPPGSPRPADVATAEA